jgi:hypothetical protein
VEKLQSGVGALGRWRWGVVETNRDLSDVSAPSDKIGWTQTLNALTPKAPVLRTYPYNVHMKLWPFVAVGAGIIIGVLLTLGIGSIWISLSNRGQVVNGFVMGFGIGFGGIAALLVLNRLIGYLDKVASGKATER